MLVTLEGMVTDFKPDKENAPFPILVTPSGMVTEDKLEQPEKA